MKTDMALSDAMHVWWSRVKRRSPDATPTPADAFKAGFLAARALYQPLPTLDEIVAEVSRND